MSLKLSIEELMDRLPPEVAGVIREAERTLDPTKDMTALEAHITTVETIVREYYEEQITAETDDPFERIAQQEEELVRVTGRNYADRFVF